MVHIPHFWCFQEASRYSLEENVLIGIAGDEDSYAVMGGGFRHRERF